MIYSAVSGAAYGRELRASPSFKMKAISLLIP